MSKYTQPVHIALKCLDQVTLGGEKPALVRELSPFEAAWESLVGPSPWAGAIGLAQDWGLATLCDPTGKPSQANDYMVLTVEGKRQLDAWNKTPEQTLKAEYVAGLGQGGSRAVWVEGVCGVPARAQPMPPKPSTPPIPVLKRGRGRPRKDEMLPPPKAAPSSGQAAWSGPGPVQS